MNNLIQVPVVAQPQAIYFTPDLVVMRHMIAGWKVMYPTSDQHRRIEVTLVTGGTLTSETGCADIPASVRKVLGGFGSNLT